MVDSLGRLHDPSTQEAWRPRVMRPEETGLEYPVLAHRNPAGDGWDVIRPLV